MQSGLPQATAKDAFAQRLVEKKEKKKCLTELYCDIGNFLQIKEIHAGFYL